MILGFKGSITGWSGCHTLNPNCLPPDGILNNFVGFETTVTTISRAVLNTLVLINKVFIIKLEIVNSNIIVLTTDTYHLVFHVLIPLADKITINISVILSCQD